jgi:hypothetical protein
MMSVIILSVNMLNVVAPDAILIVPTCKLCQCKKIKCFYQSWHRANLFINLYESLFNLCIYLYEAFYYIIVPGCHGGYNWRFPSVHPIFGRIFNHDDNRKIFFKEELKPTSS